MIKKIFFHFVALLGTILFTAFFIFIFANSVEMACLRGPNQTYNCVIEKKLFGKVTTSRRTVSGVSNAQVVQSCDSDGCAYRTELSTSNGDSVPFDDVYTDHAPVVETTNKINTLIRQGDGNTFSVANPPQLWVILLIGGLGLMGLGIQALVILGDTFRWVTKRR